MQQFVPQMQKKLLEYTDAISLNSKKCFILFMHDIFYYGMLHSLQLSMGNANLQTGCTLVSTKYSDLFWIRTKASTGYLQLSEISMHNGFQKHVVF